MGTKGQSILFFCAILKFLCFEVNYQNLLQNIFLTASQTLITEIAFSYKIIKVKIEETQAIEQFSNESQTLENQKIKNLNKAQFPIFCTIQDFVGLIDDTLSQPFVFNRREIQNRAGLLCCNYSEENVVKMTLMMNCMVEKYFSNQEIPKDMIIEWLSFMLMALHNQQLSKILKIKQQWKTLYFHLKYLPSKKSLMLFQLFVQIFSCRFISNFISVYMLQFYSYYDQRLFQLIHSRYNDLKDFQNLRKDNQNLSLLNKYIRLRNKCIKLIYSCQLKKFHNFNQILHISQNLTQLQKAYCHIISKGGINQNELKFLKQKLKEIQYNIVKWTTKMSCHDD